MERLIEGKRGIVRGVIYEASNLCQEDKKKIEEALSSYFDGKTVLLEVRKSEELICGVRIEVEGIKFDDSVLYHLKNFEGKVRGL